MIKFMKMLPGLAILAVSVIARVIIGSQETQMLIYHGVNSYRTAILLSRIGMGIGLVGTLMPVGMFLLQLRENKKRVEIVERAKHQQRMSAPLSLKSGRYNENEIRNRLKDLFSNTSDSVFLKSLRAIEGQLDQMNSYQAKLEQLLNENGANDLGETIKYLDKLEQSMFDNLRKCFNILTMYDGSDNGRQVVTEQMEDTFANNEKILEQASRLCMATTKFVNNQGEEAISLGSVEQFIKALEEEYV